MEDRKVTLLKACLELIENNGFALEASVYYDEAECDGMCLAEDIRTEIGIK